MYKLRGLPKNPSRAVEEYTEGDGQGIGWLYPAEVKAALSHHKVNMEFVSIEMRCVLNTLEFLAREIGNERVRFVFEIE